MLSQIKGYRRVHDACRLRRNSSVERSPALRSGITPSDALSLPRYQAEQLRFVAEAMGDKDTIEPQCHSNWSDNRRSRAGCLCFSSQQFVTLWKSPDGLRNEIGHDGAARRLLSFFVRRWAPAAAASLGPATKKFLHRPCHDFGETRYQRRTAPYWRRAIAFTAPRILRLPRPATSITAPNPARGPKSFVRLRGHCRDGETRD